MSNNDISIATTSVSPPLIRLTKSLAEQFNLTFSKLDPTHTQLVRTTERLEIHAPDLGNPIYVDFVEGKNAHRRKFGGGRGQPLARAIGLKKMISPIIIDATAGMGRDAFVLASLGCTVILLERNPLLAALLQDGLNRANQDEDNQAINQRMQLINIDSQHYLSQQKLPQIPDVIYIDPMYPKREKSALVKKDMRLLHQLVGPDEDSEKLLTLARKIALKRVVVKRPSTAEAIANLQPDTSIESKSTRYDIYLKHSFEAK